MNLNDYLTEVKLDDANLESIFNHAIGEIFSAKMVQKIESIFKQKLHIEYVDHKNKNEMVWTEGSKISVNKSEFAKLSPQRKVEYLTHEFIHVLLNQKTFFIASKFSELDAFTKALFDIVKKHANGNIGSFLLSKPLEEKYINNQEALAYFMNANQDWNQVSKEGAEEIKKTIINSGLFNTNSSFWKKKLGRTSSN